MKVAFDISPIQSAHQVRGIGSYTKNLYDQFQKDGNNDISFEFIQDPSENTDAQIIHHPYFDLFFHTLRAKNQPKTIVTIHDVIPLVFPEHFPAGIKGYINLLFQKNALKKCNAIICDSKTSKNDIIQKLSIDSRKVHVVYLAPAPHFKKITDDLFEIAKKYKLPKDFILYVGDVNWNKNLNNLVEAAYISKKNLVMVGKALTQENLPETQQVIQKIKNLKLENTITRLGYVPDQDLVNLYNLAKATMLPSFYEGFGLPVLESMACGTPVICSNVSSLSEISGKDAIFCDPSSPHDIAKQIKKVFTLSQKERQTLSQKLIKHTEGFTWEKVAKQTIDVYKAL